MRVHIGADHAAYELKVQLLEHLRADGHDIIDHGPGAYDAEDDYPVFCLRAAEGVVRDGGSRGVVLGGSGNGEQMAANKVKGIRAALAWNTEIARLARRHNDANVVAVGARAHSPDEALDIIDAFLAEPFSDNERHRRRIGMLSLYEATGGLPPLPA